MKPLTIATIAAVSLLSLLTNGCEILHRPLAGVTIPISKKDFDDLRAGNLLDVRRHYESKPKLNLAERALLCDIYVRHVSISQALTCLDDLEDEIGKDPSDSEFLYSIPGKRALVAYLVGDYRRAATLTRDLDTNGGRYVYALSEARLGDHAHAVSLADEWALAYNPPQVFLAANLYLATERYDRVLETLKEPERRLDRDFSLSDSGDVFGFKIGPAPLRVDLFGEFGFGLLDTYSYAPQGNVFVEYALAKAELETGNIDKALERYNTILAFPAIAAYRDIHWRTLNDRARIAETQGNTDRAIDGYKESVRIIESARSSITTDAGRIGFVGDKQEVYGNLVRLVLKEGDVTSAFEYSERARSRALVDLLSSVNKFGPRSTSREATDTMLRDFERAEVRLSEARGTQSKLESETRLRALTAEGRRLIRDNPDVAVLVLVDADTQSLADIQASLGPRETLISYYKYGSGRSLEQGSAWQLFLVQSGGIRHVTLSGTDLEAQVHQFRQRLQDGASYKELARRLYDQLIGPVQADLDLTDDLTIVPYGTLHYLPFAALLDTESKFLVAKHSISTLPSVGARRFMFRSPPSGRILAVGNPARDDTVPLPGAEEEARLVAAQSRSSSLLLIQEEATKIAFLESAPEYGILHIASHGEFTPDNPLESRLLLAPKGAGDLKVADLFRVGPQWDANMAVLSACESTLGEVAPGQDIVGLLRGFLYAGVDSVVGTLWRIPDNPTLFLMERFYEQLNRDVPRAEALKLAQLATMKRYPHPRNWAAFTFAGLNY